MTQFLYILEEILTLREYYLQKEEYCEYWLPYMWEPIFFHRDSPYSCCEQSFSMKRKNPQWTNLSIIIKNEQC